MIKNDFMNKSRSYFKPKSNVPAFLVKTYDILENPAHSEIISWNKEGTAFLVKNVNEFSDKILPKYFKHNNFSSFVRQLNMYDFHKSKQDTKENEFKHKLFRRGQRHLLAEIRRKGSENHQFNEEQMTNGVNSADLNRVKKNTNELNDELSSVKNQQGELERLGKMIYSQNSQLLNENKLLWEELSRNKEKYDKKVEKLMMFVYSVMHQNGTEAIGSQPNQKMLPASESIDALKSNILNADQPENAQKANLPLTPENNNNNKISAKGINFFQDGKPEARFDPSTDPLQPKQRSPPLFSTPTPSGLSTLPNTPGGGPMLAPLNVPNMMSGAYMQNMGYPANFNNMQNTYNGQAYFPDSNGASTSPNGTNMRKDSGITKLTRPVPSMDLPESKEFKENPVKIMKRDPETNAPAQNGQQSATNGDEPFKLDDWPLNISRGPSFNGDLSLSRLNSFNTPRMPNSLEPNFAQWPLYIQNLKSNGDNNNYGINAGKLESEGLGKMEMMNEEGIPFSPNTFIRNGGVGGYSFGQTPDDSIYRN